MSIRLLNALSGHYDLVESAATDPTIVVPSDLDFVPRPGDDLESMIWVLTYAIMLHHQEGLQGPKKAQHKLDVVDTICLTLDWQRSAFLWCSMALTVSATNLKDGFLALHNTTGLDAR